MKKHCVIIAGGECEESLLKSVSCDNFVIAADSGLKYCIKSGIIPDLIVGDFDSFSGEILFSSEVIRLPVKKDDTDLHFAARCAIKRGFTEVTVFGGYGSRPDQNFAMLSTLLWLKSNGADLVKAVCNGFEVYLLLNDKLSLRVSKNRYVSVFSINGDAKGVFIDGATYNLQNATLTQSYPIGVSNECQGDITISVNDGALIVMLVNKNI